MHNFVSILVLQSSKLVALLLLSYRCIVTTLPCGAVGLSALCDRGISWLY